MNAKMSSVMKEMANKYIFLTDAYTGIIHRLKYSNLKLMKRKNDIFK